MADIMSTSWKTLCCGFWYNRRDFEVDPQGHWEGNHLVTMVKCPNPYCPTNKTKDE